jgi:hypothetical protein
MTTYKNNLVMYAQRIERNARYQEVRNGQWLFNHLPIPVANLVAGTSFDPFHKMMSQEDIFNWLDNHLIFEDNEIIGLFHNERVLWDSKAQCVLDSN